MPVRAGRDDFTASRKTSTQVRRNARAETIIGLYKTKVIRTRGPWRHLEAVELAMLERVEWFNHRRLFEPIGDRTPAEKEEQYCMNQEWGTVA